MHGKKHPAKNSHSQSWGSWSEWKWDQREGRYYSERFDWQGNVEYTWDNSIPTADDHDSIPRTEATIDQLTTGFGGLDVNSSYDRDQAVAYPDQGGLPVASSSISEIPASPRYTHDTPYHDHHGYSHSHRDKGKGKGNATPSDIHYDEGHSGYGSVHPATNSYSQHDYPEHSDSSFESENRGRATAASFSGDNSDYELEQALKLSRDELLGNNHGSGSSTSGAHYGSESIYPGTYDLNPIDTQDGETTPRGSSPVPTRTDFTDTSVIRGTPGSVEPIDNRFIVESSYKFQPGEVFKILWSEPTGQVAGDAPISDIRAINDAAGQFYVGYRRFIIVSTDESHHSTCVPILTYDRRGCSKRGVRPNKHGIIYDALGRPKLLRGEPDLGFEPVPLEIYAEGETLAKESRVNYSKLVTIEHNVKVFFIGRIPYPYFDNVSRAVDKCWNEKMHKSRRTRR
ncbi:hypothetical protein GQX73_g2353 [Xylaria multiplex]|uniref:DUF6590 domain-containing protein n=1 Tax=Xylaria multiplex TaxID=323545 RepID=A0A7C8MYG4_9PEZI|nr:hypothetical protein GQX73_g2353 [Xylaria multiplex]